MEFTPVILIHMLSAIGAIVVGGVTLAMKKGTRMHRVFGRTWVVLMLVAALVSFCIRSSGHFSWVHLLSMFTLLAVGNSVFAAARGRIKAHRRSMINTYACLLIAGAFTFLPQRLLGHMVWQAVGLT